MSQIKLLGFSALTNPEWTVTLNELRCFNQSCCLGQDWFRVSDTFVIFFQIRDVEAIEYFLLSLPAQYKVSRFRICFRFQRLSSKCFRFHRFCFQFPLPHPCPIFYEKCFHFRLFKKSNASEFASASISLFQIHFFIITSKFWFEAGSS